jgi:molybdenum cofactor synthesis domain-containing protein
LRFNFAVLTISDRGAAGKREDKSGPAIADYLTKLGGETRAQEIIPDEKAEIVKKLKFYADKLKVDLVFTTGGTGFSPRDFTPEATKAVIERNAPGIVEAMRSQSLKTTVHAMLSRATSGIRNRTLIINLPGSPKACLECLEVFKPALNHAVEILRGQVDSCAEH